MSSIAWLIISVILFVFEAVTIGLVCIWFGIGALGAFLVSFATSNIFIQLIVFVIVSALSFLFIKPVFKKMLPDKDITNNTSRLIGKTAVVEEEINALGGRVKIGDVSWIAKANEVIEKGAMVKITYAQSNTLTVERI